MEQPVNSNRKAGFTLVEFCVATLIMMVGLLGMLKAVNMAFEQNLGTVIRNEAASVADEQMVLAKNTESSTANFVVLAQGATADSSSTVVRKLRNGNFTYNINRHDTGMSARTKEVIIRVSWVYRGKTVDHRVTSLISNPGL